MDLAALYAAKLCTTYKTSPPIPTEMLGSGDVIHYEVLPIIGNGRYPTTSVRSFQGSKKTISDHLSSEVFKKLKTI